MAIINQATKELQVKIVYYGPAMGGKTTNLVQVHDHVQTAAGNKGKLVSLATSSDRTLFFDFLPIEAMSIKGFKTKFQLYTVPGQVIYNTTRQLVLRGVDGIVFVADSQYEKMAENVESFSCDTATPASSMARNVASVQELVEVTWCGSTPMCRAKRSSNVFVRSPRPIQLLAKTSRTASSSRSPSDGWKTLIIALPFVRCPRFMVNGPHRGATECGKNLARNKKR